MDDLLSEIDTFLEKTGMTPTAFGREALKDPGFVPDLKNEGRRVWPETAEKVRTFMREYRPAVPASQPSHSGEAA